MSSTGSNADGAARRRRAQGPRSDDIMRVLAGYDSTLPILVDDVVFGTLWDRPSLSHDEQMTIAITALIVASNTMQLRNYLFAALSSGISEQKLRDIAIMCAVYAGFPATFSAIVLISEVCASYRSTQASSAPDQGE